MSEFFGQEGMAVTTHGRTWHRIDGDGGSDTFMPYNRIHAITIGP